MVLDGPLFHILLSLATIALESKKKERKKKNGFMFKRKAIDPGLHMRQKMDADLPSLP